MGQYILSGNPPIALNFKRSARARRISLRVSSLDGRVTLTVPQFVNDASAVDFAREKEAWIRKHLDAHPGEIVVGPGATLPFAGKDYLVRMGAGRGVQIDDNSFTVGGDPRQCGQKVGAFLKHAARNRLAAASDAYANTLGLRYSKLTLRDTRSRWGSCTSQGRLMYSWRLIMAPPEVLDYVAAHEVAHLQEMNHSPAFWRIVENLYGDYSSPRRWLKLRGAELHRFRFGEGPASPTDFDS